MSLETDSGQSSGDTTDGSISPAEEDIFKVAVPIIPDRFAFIRLDKPPDNPPDDLCCFCTDNELVYDSFFEDFGPLNIAKVYRYCQKVEKFLQPVAGSGQMRFLHYSSLTDDRKFANASWLVGAMAIIKLKQTPDEIFPLLEQAAQRSILAFRDASCGPPTYKLPLKDCLIALHRALELGFFAYDTFSLDEYEHYERVENGDFNWITPKLLAFCGPHQRTKLEGYPVHAPEEYFTYFKKHDISTIVRLNSPQYGAERFTAAGFEHRDLIFPDGTSPGDYILQEFLRIVETAKGGVATHCKAGLGRTGTLIAAYIMKHNQFSASEAIAWTRIVRPGSVIGQQQHYLESIKDKLWMDGRVKPAIFNNGPSLSVAVSENGDSDSASGDSNDAHVNEVVKSSSTFSTSTETTDEAGVTTVHEITTTVVETTTVVPSYGIPANGEQDSSVVRGEEDTETQGDVLNIKKAMRDKARQERCQTRSMGRSGPPPVDVQPPSPPMNDKLQKPKKLKTR